MTTEIEDKIQKLKQQGNDCFHQQKYAEAMFHYTHAIKLDPKNHSLYSNRSYVFLKLQQYHFAMDDALMTINLKPDWIKGYYRKAEVEFHTFRFNEALKSYEQALQLQPNDPDILKAINRTSRSLIKDQRADQQIPWLGAGIGIILGVIVVIADYVFTNKPTLTVLGDAMIVWARGGRLFIAKVAAPVSFFKAIAPHPLLMALLTISIAMLGFAIAKGFRYFVKCQRKSLLEPPIDLMNDNNQTNDKESNNEKTTDKHPKYSKAQARQRFKKGKT